MRGREAFAAQLELRFLLKTLGDRGELALASFLPTIAFRILHSEVAMIIATVDYCREIRARMAEGYRLNR